jgi:mono/diheme cytochrome c family protein
MGYLESGVWTRALVAERFPGALGGAGTLDEAALLALPESDRLEVGRVLFFNACNDCHSAADGYSSVAELMRGWTPEMIRSVVEHPERAQFFMPPFAGTPEEVDLLTEYLVSIARPYPPGLQIPGGG